MWLSLFTERKLYTSDYLEMNRPMLLRAHFCVNDVQFNKPAFIFSLFPPSSHVAIFIMRDVTERRFCYVVSWLTSLSRPIISFHWRKANTAPTDEQYKNNKQYIPFVTEMLSGSQMTYF